MNENAAALAKLSKGKAKTITPEERKRRAERMRANQSKRWAGHVKKSAVALLMLDT
jgi:hypothetical protein